MTYFFWALHITFAIIQIILCALLFKKAKEMHKKTKVMDSIIEDFRHFTYSPKQWIIKKQLEDYN